MKDTSPRASPLRSSLLVITALVTALGLSACAPTRERFTVAPPPPGPAPTRSSQPLTAPENLPPGGREGRMNENRCVEIFMENIAMMHSLRNRCDFGLNVVFNINDPGSTSGLDHTLSRTLGFKPHGAQALDIIRHDRNASVAYWACHYTQRPVYKGTRPASASSNGQPLEIWRCEDFPRP